MKAEAPPHLRRGRQIAAGGKADAGAIHCARAGKMNRVEPPKAAKPKKKDIPEGMSFFL